MKLLLAFMVLLLSISAVAGLDFSIYMNNDAGSYSSDIQTARGLANDIAIDNEYMLSQSSMFASTDIHASSQNILGVDPGVWFSESVSTPEGAGFYTTASTWAESAWIHSDTGLNMEGFDTKLNMYVSETNPIGQIGSEGNFFNQVMSDDIRGRLFNPHYRLIGEENAVVESRMSYVFDSNNYTAGISFLSLND